MIVGRRTGKTVVELGVALWRMVVEGAITLPSGLTVPFRGAHTAQKLATARERFFGDLVGPIRDALEDDEWEPRFREIHSNDRPSLTYDADPHTDGTAPSHRHDHAHRMTVVPPTYDGVRGEGYAHLSFDEVMTFKLEQGQNLMSAARPTMKDFMGHAQMWRVSNVGTFSDSSSWLREIRDRGRDAVAGDRGIGQAYFEWTIPDDADPLDERVWWDHYPPLADGSVLVEDLRSDLAEMSTAAFAAEYLGRWPDAIASAAWQAITEDTWTQAGTTDPMPEHTPAAIGIGIDPYGRSSSIVAATVRPGTDTVMLEVLDHRPGSGWLEATIRELAPTVAAIGLDDYGAGHDLRTDLEDPETDADLAAKLVSTAGQSLYAACYALDAGIREHRVQWRASDYHRPLFEAVKAAQRTSGRTWQWEQRVAVSQSPLVAATEAMWALGHAPAAAPDSEIF